jgi:hypothetical protein
VTRIVDRGAITAAYVGIGMAVTIGVSFLLVIPIEPIYWFLALPAGLLIGYYANQRSDRRKGPWSRIVLNAVFAGVVTGLTLAALLLAVKALFFFADNGYPDFNRVDANGVAIGETCQTGADCVYRRYLALQPADLAAAGVTDAASFSNLYWSEQWSTARLLVGATTGAALFGAFLFGIAGPRRNAALKNVAAATA